MFRPNADLATDSTFRQVMAEVDERENEAIVGAQEQFFGQQGRDISTALGIDEQQLNLMIQLATLDVQSIMFKTGLDFQRASEFKQMFAQFGSQIASSAFQRPQEIIVRNQ